MNTSGLQTMLPTPTQIQIIESAPAAQQIQIIESAPAMNQIITNRNVIVPFAGSSPYTREASTN